MKNKLTIVIPIQIDHEDRMRNINITTGYLRRHFDCEIIICEQDTESKLVDVCKDNKCKHIFIENNNFFNRLKLLNIAVKEVTTPVFALYDADVLLRPEQIIGATEAIIQGRAQLVYPYNGKFYDVPKKFFDDINETKDLTKININDCILHHPNSVGGVVLFDREHYWKCGGGNENFKNAGYEDDEFNTRFKNLGTKIMRTEWPLLHLTHERGITSHEHNPYITFNREYYLMIARMSPEQLKAHVNEWQWHKSQ
jgi:hypothetical protein